MNRLIYYRPSFLRAGRITVSLRRHVATSPPKHPNPSNFANRSPEEMSEIGHRGGKIGASRGGRAARKAAEQTLGNDAKQPPKRKPQPLWRSHEPPIIAPAFGEWQT
ncbi:hypothetical protein PDE_09541 [Penicillium oxalicum 114-2]|uniref:Uncharacterized protein n=1 Tax=Penicillium oxalicum (strain 114-2 / CGMCC 5302) TaxID=933388 RepID=S8BHD9_PENO1|nr:hypothetical protein PDE_09541 [Penicillium oxalicum 114-2]